MSSRKDTITISPEVLVWARSSIGYTLEDAAKKIGVALEILESWELDGSSIPFNKLKVLASVYKRPTSIFLLSKPPLEHFPKEFRRHMKSMGIVFSPDTNLAIRKAVRIQTSAIDLFENTLNVFVKELGKLSRINDPELVATEVSKLLNIDYSHIFKIYDDFAVLKYWKELIESKGILVLELKFDPYEARGFALFDEIAPLITLSTSDSPHARIFTLFHELAHFIYKRDSIVSKEEEFANPLDDPIEVFCNHFAGAILVPKNNLIKVIEDLEITDEKILDDELLESISDVIAKKFKVSRYVVLRRLMALDYISGARHNDVLRTWRNKFSNHSSSNGGGNYYNIVVKNNSKLFITKLLDAYDSHKLTASNLIEYLNVKVENIEKLEKHIYG